MQISTRTRYGLRFMVYLSMKYDQGLIQLNEVAENENISAKYLEQIVPYLKAANLVRSQRGNAGGYQLARNPQDIKIKDIVLTLEGNMVLVDCSKKTLCVCERFDVCALREMWGELSRIILSYLDSITLYDLVQEQRPKLYQILR